MSVKNSSQKYHFGGEYASAECGILIEHILIERLRDILPDGDFRGVPYDGVNSAFGAHDSSAVKVRHPVGIGYGRRGEDGSAVIAAAGLAPLYLVPVLVGGLPGQIIVPSVFLINNDYVVCSLKDIPRDDCFLTPNQFLLINRPAKMM